ncbi:hypothetical protein F5Y04DRAFT_71699 [Hypomontagnella monticulosa]|nr:hypothetical protein F5Y04DRAFT_71699 [Hypomontagnella monticulosa]
METSSRRKACDTCFKKKIKCDMLKPACSNCLLYKVPCSTTVLRRRAAPVSQKDRDTYVPSPVADGDSLEARLARIEAKLDRLGASGYDTAADQLLSSISSQAVHSAASSTGSSHASSTSSPQSLERHGGYHIPPLTEILPIIEDYFRDFNSALPLFHQRQFMQMLYEFYSEEERTNKSRAFWAAINVVLAIGFRMRTVETDDIVYRFDDTKVKQCIDNAQKELDELVTREEDTLGIQVIIGLVLLFQTNTDQNPASVLIGTAVRLAHKLQLHMKSTYEGFTPEEARQRRNIFWLCYYLDKDISIRSKIPSIQNDQDMDVDLPEDDGNYLQSMDGRSQLNYLRARVQLAYVEGKVYDYLLSNRSTKISLQARQERVSHLAMILHRWMQTIPAALHLENITETLGKAPLTHMILLYHTYLMCYTTINGLYSLDSPWMKSIRDNSTHLLYKFDTRSYDCMRHTPALLPQFWATCVGASRGCLRILNDKCYSGCNLWLGGCAYFSAFIVLLANIIYYPLHDLVEFDRGLTMDTMGRLEKLLEYTGSDSFKKLYVILVGLTRAADQAVEQAKNVAETYDPDWAPEPPWEFDVFTGNINQNLVSQPDMSTGLTHVSTFDTCELDIPGFGPGDDLSVPIFMSEFS